MKKCNLQIVVSCLVFMSWVANCQAENNTAIMTAIMNNVKVVCQSPPDQGKHWSVDMKGDGGVNLGLNFLKDAHLETKGEAEFSKEEWEGVQQVLREQQFADNNDYRKCVRDLTPLFLEKFSNNSESTDNGGGQIKQQTSGQYSPAISNTKGDVNFNIGK
jgi:hypothetical protein